MARAGIYYALAAWHCRRYAGAFQIARPKTASHEMNILGINAFHGDSAVCLVRDGVLVNAAEEERFRRIKHWAVFRLRRLPGAWRMPG